MARKKKNSLKPGIYAEISEGLFGIAYAGTINVKIIKDNKVYSNTTFHNLGRWPLFYFLSGCLAGDYQSMEAFRPKYVDLFTIDGDDIPTIDDTTDLTAFFKIENRVSTNTYPYTSAPDVERTGNSSSGIGSSTIKYKFAIPFTQLQTAGDGSIMPIKAVCLYADSNKGEWANPSAFFLVTNKAKDKLVSLIEDASNFNSAYLNEYSLFIEWELAISNPKKNTGE